MPKLSEVEEKLREIMELREGDPKRRYEYLDPFPVAPPIGWKKPVHIVDQIRDMVRRELSDAARNAGHESFEEAEDFDVDEEYDPTSPWEEMFEPTPVSELRERQRSAEASPVAPQSPPNTSPNALNAGEATPLPDERPKAQKSPEKPA